MDARRSLLVIADDYGIGPETSRGIRDLARRRLVTGSVLLVTSPYAEEAVSAWHSESRPMELGWHPCLTLDRPISSTELVRSLVDRQGFFFPLPKFIIRLSRGLISHSEIHAELSAQLRRFAELTGQQPRLVNAHQHVAIFEPIGSILVDLLQNVAQTLWFRAVREPWRQLLHLPGARAKRFLLNRFGRRQALRHANAGFFSADWLLGLADPADAVRPDYFTRWLDAPDGCLELMCHPGYADRTLSGRDGTPQDGFQASRVNELQRLTEPAFTDAIERAGFELIRPSEYLDRPARRRSHAA